MRKNVAEFTSHPVLDPLIESWVRQR